MKIKNSYSNIYKLNLYAFFHSFIFYYIIERLFEAERGLSIQEMVYLEIVYATSIIIFEIPTGILADIWSRKRVMILSSFCFILYFYGLSISFSFIGFALSVVCAAFSGALSSGTLNAIYYDSLKENNKELEFEKVLATSELYASISASIGALVGSWVATRYNYTYTSYLSIITVFIAFLITFTLIEPKRSYAQDEDNEIENNSNIKTSYKEILDFFKNDKILYHIILVSILMVATIGYIDEYWQIYFEKVNFPIILFGIYSIFREFFSAISRFLAYKIKEKISITNIFSISLFFSALFIIITGFMANKIGIIFMTLVFIFSGMIDILSLGYIHHKVESKYRATIESVFNFIERFFVIIIGLIFSYVSTNFSIFSGFIFLGIFMLLSFVILKFGKIFIR
ncbi:MAG: MFS transporter [Candidatus Sericytochromatia bacterium]